MLCVRRVIPLRYPIPARVCVTRMRVFQRDGNVRLLCLTRTGVSIRSTAAASKRLRTGMMRHMSTATHRPAVALAAWDVCEDRFPRGGSPEQRLEFALRYAVLAPSTHDTQPWRFAIAGETVALYADGTRKLPTLDPGGRELLMSCGAALFHLRIALRPFRLQRAGGSPPRPPTARAARACLSRRLAPAPTRRRRALRCHALPPDVPQAFRSDCDGATPDIGDAARRSAGWCAPLVRARSAR